MTEADKKQSRSPGRRWGRFAVLGLGGLVFLTVISIALGLLWLDSAPGQRWLTKALNVRLASSGIEISRIYGALYSNPRIDTVTLSDDKGPYLRLRNIDLAWQPGALLKGRLQINALSAEQITMQRLPQSETQDRSAAPELSIPTLPDLPLDIAIDTIMLPRITLLEDVAGQMTILSAFVQSARLGKGTLALDAVMTRLDAPAKDEMALRLAYDENTRLLDLDLQLSGAKGGLIASVLSAQPDEGASFELKGTGPLRHWQGRVSAGLGERIRYDGTISGDGHRLGITGDAHLAGLVPAPYQRLLEPSIRLDLDADFARSDRLPFDLMAQTPAGRAGINGIIVPEDLARLALDFSLVLENTADLSELAGDIAFQAARLKGTVAGTLNAPLIAADLEIQSPIMPKTGTADYIHAVITASRDQDIINTQIEGGIDRLILADLAPFSPQLNLRARFDMAKDRLELEDVRIVSDGVNITATGWLTTDGKQLSLQSDVTIDDLKALPLPLPATGGLEASVDLEKPQKDSPLAVNLRADGKALSPDDETLGALLGNSPRLEGRASLTTDGDIRLDRLSLDASGMAAEAEGRTMADGSDIAIGYALRLHDLKTVIPAAPLVIAGGVTLTGDLTGSLNALGATAESRIDRIQVQNTTLTDIEIRAKADDLTGQPSARLTLDAASPFGAIHLETSAALLNDDSIEVPALLATVGEARLTGALTIGPDGLVRGNIKGISGNLSDLPQNGRTGIRGNLSLDMSLNETGGAQSIKADILAEKLIVPIKEQDILELESLHATSDVRLTSGLPQITAQLDMTDATLGFTRLTDVAIKADSDDNILTITGAATGDWRGALALEGGLSWQAEENDHKLSLDLDGTLFGQTIVTPAPVKADISGENWQLRPFLIQIADGEINGSAERAPERVGLTMALRDLPLELINVVAPRLLPTGTLSADLRLDQREKDVTANLRMTVADMAPALSGFAQIPAVTGHLDAALENGQLTMAGEADAEDALQAAIRLEMPLDLDLLEGTTGFSEHAPLNGRMTWHGALAPLFMMANLPRHEASGDLSADLALSGTVGTPDIDGTLSLHDVRYEHLDSGFVATDLTLDARLTNRRLVIESLNAGDGNSGNITGKGRLELDEADALLADVELTLTNVAVIRRVDATVVSSADLRFELSRDAMRASGTITPDRADINIAKSLPPDVVTIDVVELNTTEEGESPDRQPSSDDRDLPLELDFKVDALRRLFVRGRGLDSEWSADLQINGTADAPTIEGTANLLKGSFDFAGKRFTLDGGQLLFTGARKIDPLLDIEAREQMNGYDVTLTITGPLSQPSISLGSAPPLPEDEILSRLLFGESVSELSPLQAVQLASALGSLSGGGGLDLVGSTRSALGLDRLNIDMPDDSSAGTRITGGKYLTDDVYFEVSTETGSGITKGTLEWSLTKRLSLQSRMSSSQDNAITIRWSWRY